ncbi:MAG: hypothetical protein ACM3U2_16085 [Deltaproteobacteria bacterium]
MGRWHCSLAGLLGIVTLFSGCATNRPGNPFASRAGTSASARATDKAAAEDLEVADAKMNPRGRNAGRMDAPALNADAQRQMARGNEPAAPRAPFAGGHDPETQSYIEQELRDATPEERADYAAALKGLQPEAVRKILHSRRLTQRAVQKQREIAAQRPESFGPPVIQTAGAEAPPRMETGIRRAATGEGLGSVSAWPRQAEDAGRAPPNVSFAGTIDTNPAPTAPAGQGSGPPPLGHSSGYRVDPGTENTAAGGYALVRPGPASPGRVNPAGGQLAPGQYNVNLAGSSVSAPPPRGSAIRPAAVSVGSPMSAGAAPAAQGIPAQTGNPPADGAAREQLARYIAVVEAEASELQPGETEMERLAYIEKQVHLRMLYLMSGQQERALQAIPGLDPADQEFWQQTFWGLTNYFDTASIPSDSERATQTVTQMTNAVLRLQEKARLELRNVTFCHKISSFGNYEKYSRDEFSPGQEVLLYAEVANIHSEPVSDGKFRTKLKSTIEIFRHGPQGELMERIDLPETVDVCRTHRRDYFHSYQFTIPAKLALGPHVLTLSVEDQLSRRVGTYTLNFMVK